MKALLNPQTLRAIDRLVVTLDRHRFGACMFLAILSIVAIITVLALS